MATFELTAPDGGVYHVDAPDERAAVAALGQLAKAPAQQQAAAPAAVAEPKSALQGIREAIQAPTRALENGVFLGLGDRARALIDSGVEALGGNGFNYGANLKKQQGDTAQFAKDHPIAAPVLEATGGVVAPVGVLSAAAKGAGLGTKMVYGGAAGAGIGGAQGAASSKDWTDLPQVAKDAAFGSGAGLVLGGAMPAAAKAAGAGYNAAANLVRGRVEGMSRPAGNHLIGAMEADGPAAVQARLQELGPDAMLVDAGPALLGKGQGAALNSDEGRSVLTNALTTRDKGTNARIRSDVDAAIGPAQDEGALTASDRIRRLREEGDAKSYPVALQNAPPVKIAPIMTELIDRIDQAPVGSPEHKALSAVQTMLTKKVKTPLVDSEGFPQYDNLGQEKFVDVPVSHDDAGILHKAKVAIDNYVEHNQPGLGLQPGALNGQQAALKQVRYQLNSALEDQVPGYANANRQSAALAKRVEAVQAGTQYLGNGKTTPTPERFAFDFQGLDHGEKIALAKGSRAEIDRVLGTKANDLQALRGELQGEGGYNAAKLATVHGQEAADQLVATVDRNLAFRNTHNKVVENSQTAQRQAAANAMKPVPAGEVPMVNPNMTVLGFAGSALKKAGNAAWGQVRPDATRSYGEVARALTEQGATRDARIRSIVDALDRRKGNAAVSVDAGNRTSLLAAIAANGLANSRRRNQQ